MNKKIFVGLLAVAAVLGMMWYSGIGERLIQRPVTSGDGILPGSLVHDVPESDVPATGGTVPAGFARLEPNAIYVADQLPGTEFIITIVNLASPGYVVIHESEGGKPGAVIGASALIENPESKNVNVSLSRSAKDGEEFIAMLHTEKDVVGFDPATDLPVRDASDNAMYMVFTVRSDAPNPESVEIMF
ncbi:MAG: hypothetical protein AAB932_05415 [Patescibacteria group bacterium]